MEELNQESFGFTEDVCPFELTFRPNFLILRRKAKPPMSRKSIGNNQEPVLAHSLSVMTDKLVLPLKNRVYIIGFELP